MNGTKSLVADGDGTGFEPVRGDAIRRKTLLLQWSAVQLPCRSGAASSLDQEVEHLPFIVDGPPQPVFSATDLDDHLVEMPVCAWPWTAAAKIAGDQEAELQEPAPDRLVRNVNAPLCQKVFHIAKRKREPGVEPDGAR